MSHFGYLIYHEISGVTQFKKRNEAVFLPCPMMLLSEASLGWNRSGTKRGIVHQKHLLSRFVTFRVTLKIKVQEFHRT